MGISDPYEEPTNAEIVIDSEKIAQELLVERIITEIKELKYF